MGRTGNQLFDEVILVDTHSLDATAATVLGLEFVNWQPLDVAVVGESNDNIFLFNQVLVFDIGDVADLQFSPPLVAKLTLDLHQFVIDDLMNSFIVGQDVLVIGNGIHQLLVFSLDLLPFQTG